MALKTSMIQFTLRLGVYSVLLALLAYMLVALGWLKVGIETILSIQLFVIIVTMVIHFFLMRSAGEIRIQKFMFNFMLSVTLKIFIYCGAFVALIYAGNHVLAHAYSKLSLFMILFSFYLLYTVFEVASIMKFVRKMK